MPPQPIISKRVGTVHAAMIDAGWQGKEMKRHHLEAFLARHYGLSAASVRLHIDTGRILGLWRPISKRPDPGTILVLPPSTAIPDSQ